VKPKGASASGGETAEEDILLGSPLVVQHTDARSSSSSSAGKATDVAGASGEAAASTNQKRKPASGPTLLQAPKK